MYYVLAEARAKGNFVVSIDRGTYRGFLCFESTDEFLSWYELLKPEEKTLNEVITSDLRKLILDIDSPDDPQELSKFFMYDWPRHVTARINEVFDVLDIGTPNVITYDMCSQDKISYHFAVSNFAFSAKTCMGLCAIIRQGQIWERFVDTGVYKSIQCIRLEGSTKFGEQRWKIRAGICPEGENKTYEVFAFASHPLILQGKGPEARSMRRIIPVHAEAKTSDICMRSDGQRQKLSTLEVFGKGPLPGSMNGYEGVAKEEYDLLGTVNKFKAKANTSNRAYARECLLLSDLRDVCVPDVSCSVVYDKCSLAKARDSLVYDASLLDHFEVRRACNRTVFLKRIKPGFCSQCNRVHNKENAMVKYDRYGRQRFVCWRFVFRSC